MSFFDFFLGLAINRQKKDFKNLIAILKGLDCDELFLLYMMVNSARITINKEYNIELLYPFLVIEQRDDIIPALWKNIRAANKENSPASFSYGAALTVWLFTLRAAIRPELRYLGKEMWKMFSEAGGHDIPDGFTPDEVAEKEIYKKNVSFSSQENKIMLDGIIHLFYEYVNKISEEELFKICGESDALYDFILSKLIDGRRDEVAEDDFAIGVIGPLITEAFSHGKKERGLALDLCLIKCCEKYIFMNDEYSKIKKRWFLVKNRKMYI